MEDKLKALEIKKDFYWVGALDPGLRVFDIIMYTPFGTTYNSYVLKGSEKIAVFETVKEKYFDQYIERLTSLDIDISKIDYIVVNHTEPDHAGSVAKLLSIAKNAKVVGSSTAIRFLKEIVNCEFEYIIANHNETLSLGNKTLKFVSAPFLHWPDSMYTFIKEDNVLISCDSFGSHYCDESITNKNMASEENYNIALKYYFDCIFGPFKSYVLKAIDKIKDLKIDIIAPGHGPVLTENPLKIIETYKGWSTPELKNSEEKVIVIPYVSAYGYTETLALNIAEGIKTSGNIQVELINVIDHDLNEVISKVSNADGVLFGTPTINGDALKPIMDILVSLSPLEQIGKFSAAFGSYGWSGEGVPNVEERLKQLKMKVPLKGLKVNFKPSEENVLSAIEFGKNFGDILNGKAVTPTATTEKEKVIINGGKKFWQCVICGLIVEGATPPDSCVVCGAGSDQFIEIENKAITFTSEENSHFVIVGNGAAGFYAAEAIRKRNKIAKIDIISAESYKTYYRPALSDYLSEELGNDFYVAKDNWYIENNIRLHLNTVIETIDTNNKRLILKDGKEMSYDKLILATGSNNFIPEIPGIDKKGVFTLKTFDDAKGLKDAMKTSKSGVVVGGGLLGLEAAWEMKTMGIDVTVVEFFDRLLPRQIDEERYELFKQQVEKSGVNFILSDSVVQINGRNSVREVLLKSGKTISADLILFSIGIRPNIELAITSGIKVNKGIVVNEKMETSEQNIYSAGDNSEIGGILYGNWTAATAMATVAGANAAGDTSTFESFVSSVIFKALGVELVSFGSISIENCKKLELRDDVLGTMKKLYFKDEILVGGFLIGDLSDGAKLIDAIKYKNTLKGVLLSIS